MAFLKNISKVFGFTGTEIEDETDSISIPKYEPTKREPYINPFKNNEGPSLNTPKPNIAEGTSLYNKPNQNNENISNIEKVEDLTIPEEFLDKISDVINSFFPPVMQKCIDRTAEHAVLLDLVGEPFNKFVSKVNAEAMIKGSQKWIEEKSKLEKQLQELREKDIEMNAKRDELQNLKLSAERQKRAFSDKIQDLETKIATLESEREQFDLENKSLLNKLKVASVNADETEKLRTENDSMLSEINTLRSEILKAKNEEPKSLEADVTRIAELEKILIEKDEALIAANNNDLDNQILALTKEKEELIANIASNNDEISNLKSALDEANNNLLEIEKIQETLSQFEALKAKKDKKIQELQESLTNANNTIDTMNTTIESINNKSSQILEQKISEKESIFSAKISKLTIELQSANNTISSLNTEISKLKEENSKAINSMAKSSESQSDIADLNAKLTNLNTTLDAIRKQRNELALKADKQDSEIESIKKLLAEREDTITNLEKQLEDISKQNDMPSPKKGIQPINQISVDKSDNNSSISVIDEDDMDWLIPTPPNDPQPIVEEPIKQSETTKKAVDDTQMTLW